MIWILVASASEARVFSTTGSRDPLVEREDMLHSQGRSKTSELVSDQPGKQGDASLYGAHAVEEKSDIKAHERDAFARELCDFLAESQEQHKFHRLYLVAPSHMLGAVNKHLHKYKNVRDTVEAEFDLQLVKASAEDIRRHLPEYL